MHLPLVQHRFRRAERSTLHTQRTPLTSSSPPSRPAEVPGELGVLSDHPPDRLQRSQHRTDGPRRPARLRQGPQGMPQRGPSLAHPRPVNPMGIAGTTFPRQQPGQEEQDGPRGPPARLTIRARPPIGTLAQPRRTAPLPRPRGILPATPSPMPTTTAVPLHPSLVAWPGTTTHTNPRRTGAAAHAGPGSVAPAAPSAGPRHP